MLKINTTAKLLFFPAIQNVFNSWWKTAIERDGHISLGRELQSFGATTEKALTQIVTCLISEGEGTWNKASKKRTPKLFIHFSTFHPDLLCIGLCSSVRQATSKSHVFVIFWFLKKYWYFTIFYPFSLILLTDVIWVLVIPTVCTVL